MQLVICAAPDYLQRHGAPTTLAALQSHRCSVFRHPATGAVVPWRVKVGDDVRRAAGRACDLHQRRDPGTGSGALRCGHRATGRRDGSAVHSFWPTGPLLVDHIPDHASYFVYFGSRTAQTARARAFIDLAVKRLGGSPEYVLTHEELRPQPKAPRRR